VCLHISSIKYRIVFSAILLTREIYSPDPIICKTIFLTIYYSGTIAYHLVMINVFSSLFLIKDTQKDIKLLFEVQKKVLEGVKGTTDIIANTQNAQNKLIDVVDSSVKNKLSMSGKADNET
jgi:hypothetical protein